jgi:hypothetical protein
MYLGGYFGRYFPPSLFGHGWVDRHTLVVPMLSYAFFQEFAFKGAWLCLPTSLGKHKIAALQDKLRRTCFMHSLPYVLEYFTLYPVQHSLYETNFRLPAGLAVDRRVLMSFLEEARFGHTIYRSVGIHKAEVTA